jgi:hypothetical protein
LPAKDKEGEHWVLRLVCTVFAEKKKTKEGQEGWQKRRRYADIHEQTF